MVRVELDRICEYDGFKRCKTRVVDVEWGCVECAGFSREVKEWLLRSLTYLKKVGLNSD